jgi:hypothetical protein
MTFDAFAKSLVDRFGQALPAGWRPTPDYRIDFPKPATYSNFLSSLGDPPRTVGTRADLEAIGSQQFEREVLLGAPLPREWPERPTVEQWAAQEFWRSSLRARRGSALSFPMIGRLAELVVRTNPHLRRALTITYSHVFLDEFQDTTQIQYDLTRTICLGSTTVLTAVGDNKQQIMRWAMAMANPFVAFERDFRATRTTLRNNYRSSPELVRIQHVLAQAIDADSVEAVSMMPGQVAGESCEVWDLQNPKHEANIVATFIAAEMMTHGLGPRDFVLLVRQKAGEYVDLLAPALASNGIMLRNEAAEIGPVRLQELLAEELSDLVVRILRVATTDRAGQAWVECLHALAELRGISEGASAVKLGRDLERFTFTLRERFADPSRRHPRANPLQFFDGHALEAALPAGLLDSPDNHPPDERRDLLHALGGRIVPPNRSG